MVVSSLALVFRILFAVVVLKLHDYSYRSFSRNFILESLFNKVAGLHIETSSLICIANHKHLTT